jgi:DNA anti-recombination protein RmuC
MDLETASAIESLRNDLDRSTTDLADRILAVETSLGRKLATTDYALRAEIRQVREEVTRDLRAEMRQMREEVTRDLQAEMRQIRDEVTRDLRAEMGQVRDEVTRNAAVLTESVRGDVGTVADGLATVSAQLVAVGAKIDALNR